MCACHPSINLNTKEEATVEQQIISLSSIFWGEVFSYYYILPYTENFATTLNHKFKQIKKGTGLYILHGSISILNVCALYTYTDKREIHPRAGYSKKTKRGGMFIFMQLSLHVTTNMTKYILIFRATNSRHLSQL